MPQANVELHFTKYAHISMAGSGYPAFHEKCVNVREYGDVIVTLALACQTKDDEAVMASTIRQTAKRLFNRMKSRQVKRVLKKVMRADSPCEYLISLWDSLADVERQMKEHLEN